MGLSRVCGGTSVGGCGVGVAGGLSPRVRGNQYPHPAGRVAAGSIPACAGEPCRGRGCRRVSRVYPRVCGGTRRLWGGRGYPTGLSPRVRGNPVAADEHLQGTGSIPACAGEPRTGCRCWPNPGVYPRVCGGTTFALYLPPVSEGLSPRVRGNPPLNMGSLPVHGSIPACAGEPSPNALPVL